MEYSTLVRERESCKKYDGRKADREALMKVLVDARFAPTAKNLQEQKIYVIESDELLKKIDEVSPCRYNAGTVLVVAYDKDNVYTYPESDRTSGIEDATIVATHLVLAAKNAGLDSCWVNCFNPDKMAKLLDLPENEEVLMMLDLGYAASDATPNPNHGVRKDLNETVVFM